VVAYGLQVQDENGDEADGMDEAFGTLDEDYDLGGFAQPFVERLIEKLKYGGDNSKKALAVFGKAFMGVFIAEWGDRTQIAMIGQHASQPLIPVCIGSLIAFFLLTVSASR